MQIIELKEYESKIYPRRQFSQETITVLRKEYSSQIKIKLKDVKNSDYWELKAQGWVGYIPVCSELAIRIMPKIPIANLLGMLEYAYNLKSFRFFNSLTRCATLEDFYNCLVKLLCELILQISRQGLYKAYVTKTDRLTYIRGRLDIRNTLKHPGNVKFVCHYNEQTTDIPENQILLWTLHLISRHHLCNEVSKSLVRKTYHALHSLASLKSFTVLDL
jgi:5-methylcytosine-specific restriction enzyme subunit McrC